MRLFMALVVSLFCFASAKADVIELTVQSQLTFYENSGV